MCTYNAHRTPLTIITRHFQHVRLVQSRIEHNTLAASHLVLLKQHATLDGRPEEAILEHIYFVR
jgi:hypothetical protein